MIILFNDSRARKKEIGILSAIGENKVKIAMQICIEQLYILSLAFILLLFIAPQTSEIIIQSIISSNLFEPGITLLDENYVYPGLVLKDSFIVFLQTYVVCLIIITISTLIPILLTLRKSTTQILSDNS